MDAPQRLIIRGTNWIGDSVMSLPALREVRRIYAQAHITLLVRPWVAGVFAGQGLVDEIRLFRQSESALQRCLFWSRRMRGFSALLLFQNAFNAAFLGWLARIPERIGYATDGRGRLLTRRAVPRIRALKRHQVYYYLDLLFQTGVSSRNYLEDPDFLPDLSLQAGEANLLQAASLLRENGVEPKRPLIGLNPGAFFGPAKRWFSDRYAALADRLIDNRQAEILILGSAGEQPIAEEIRSRMKRQAHVLCGKTDLTTLIGLISMCRLLITNDSGPMHLAAALNTRQIALFGSTDETATGPFSTQAAVIRKPVECSPCLLRECPIDLRCFDRIQVDEVYASALARL